MTLFRKRPVEVQAVQWTGDKGAVVDFLDADVDFLDADDDFILRWADGTLFVDRPGHSIRTVPMGFWIVRGRDLDVLADEDFRAAYEPVDIMAAGYTENASYSTSWTASG